MGIAVYANGNSIACKAAGGKSTAAMPDVCFTQPTTPATPTGVPIPYPNTGSASDTTDGSKTVMIGGEEVMLKDKSSFKTSTGDEAGNAPKKGVVTSKIQGKVNFSAWSMDVKFEGENVPRHMDITLHNEASLPANTPTWPYFDSMNKAQQAACKENKETEEKACGYDEEKGQYTKSADQCCESPACQKARKCMLVPYGGKGSPNCCDGQSAHHLVEVHGFCESGDRGSPLPPFDGSNGRAPYNQNAAPCVCATSPNSNWEAEHGDLHSCQGILENNAIGRAVSGTSRRRPEFAWNYGEARQAGVTAHSATFPKSECKPDCIAAQLDTYHKTQVGARDSSPMRTEKYGFGDTKVDQLKRGTELLAKHFKSLAGNAGTTAF